MKFVTSHSMMTPEQRLDDLERRLERFERVHAEKLDSLAARIHDNYEDRRFESGPSTEQMAQVLREEGATGRCNFGLPCPEHHGAVHGKEAEELRTGIEKLLAENSYQIQRTELFALLDRVDARDSLAYLETQDKKGEG